MFWIKDWRRHVVWQINIYIILMQWGLLTRAFYYDSTRTDIYPMLFCYISWTPICSNSKKLLKTSTVILLLTMIRVLNSDTWAFQMQISSKRFRKSLSFWGRNYMIYFLKISNYDFSLMIIGFLFQNWIKTSSMAIRYSEYN